MLSNNGRIELIMGPMFAGKTTELMRRVKREIHARRSCFVIKYSKDVRYDKSNVASHDHLTLRAQASVCTLADVGSRWKNFDVVAVDEGQFFPDLVPFCNTAADAGKVVMVSALDGDYLRKPFGQICELVPYCESVEKLTAVCMMCHVRQAAFTRRTVQNDAQELIGGADMYIATCRQCYNEKTAPSALAMRTMREAIREVEEACLGIARPVCVADAATSAKNSASATPVKKACFSNADPSSRSTTSSSDDAGLTSPDSPESPIATVRLNTVAAAREAVKDLSADIKIAAVAAAAAESKRAHRVQA